MKKYKQQKQRVEAERKKLDEVRLRVQETCQKCYLKARLDLFEEVQGALKEYTECLSNLQICHKDYINTLQYKKSQELYLEEIEQDLDDIRYEWQEYHAAETKRSRTYCCWRAAKAHRLREDQRKA